LHKGISMKSLTTRVDGSLAIAGNSTFTVIAAS
jgi:hypothetical protein